MVVGETHHFGKHPCEPRKFHFARKVGILNDLFRALRRVFHASGFQWQGPKVYLETPIKTATVASKESYEFRTPMFFQVSCDSRSPKKCNVVILVVPGILGVNPKSCNKNHLKKRCAKNGTTQGPRTAPAPALAFLEKGVKKKQD